MNWYIHVAGYGGFDFEGTHEEALEMRAHKARWEQGIGYLWGVADDGKITRAWPAPGRPGCWDMPPTGNGPQDEMLLAEAIARWHEGDHGDRENPEYLLDEPGGPRWLDNGSVQAAYADGLLSVLTTLHDDIDPCGHYEAYATGAALGMALESVTLAAPGSPPPIEFRRPPPRFVLQRVQGASGAAEDRVLCATLADVCAAMRAWFPSDDRVAWPCNIDDVNTWFFDSISTGTILARMTEVFE